jgi:hypothetical protein
MNNKKYKVSYNGECTNDKDTQVVKENLAKLLKIDFNKVEIFFNGDSIDIKNNIDYETAEKYRKAFEKIGAICRIESLEEEPINNLPIETSSSNAQKIINEDYQDNSALSEHKSFSFRRYLLNIIVRFSFFVCPIPVHSIFTTLEYRIPSYAPEYIPFGITFIILGIILGGMLDILLQESLIGGKIAVSAFNIGTLSKFEDIKFKVEVGASGKGISIKDKKE